MKASLLENIESRIAEIENRISTNMQPTDAPDIVEWAESEYILAETGAPIQLEEHQKRILREITKRDKQGRLIYQTVVYSAPKKSGKTEIAALLTLYWALFLCKSYGEIYCCANDLEQAQSRVFNAVVKAVEANPNVEAHITQRGIVFPNGTKIIALASDYRGAAGANQDLSVFDELWAYSSESARRLYEEMTPVPTKESTRLVVTYAGFLNESALLHELYQMGTGERIFDDLPVFRNGRIFLYWDTEARMPWQTSEYYAEQRKILRPNQYKRLHENAWVAAESQFIAIEKWDACVNSELSPAEPNKEISICVGIDASIRHDYTAAVAVTKLTDDTIRLGHHTMWKPLRGEINFAEVEKYILWLHENFHLTVVRYDPFQFASSAQRLESQGVRLEEYPQTTNHLTEAGSLLYELIDSQRLEVYPDADFRQQIQNVVALETTRGFRIAKEQGAKKIDLIAALSFACVGAIEQSTAKYEARAESISYSADELMERMGITV